MSFTGPAKFARRSLYCGAFALALGFVGSNSSAQDEGAPAAAAPAAPPAEEVVIKREALQLLDGRAYRIPILLEPIRRMELVAPVDGLVGTVSTKVGAKVAKEAAIIQLDSTMAELRVKRAKALVTAAKVEKRVAEASKNADSVELTSARLEAAETEAALVDAEVQLLTLRAKFAGDVARLFVREGQFVRRGETLAVLTDASKLQVDLPADRASLKEGGSLKFKVEGNDLEGKIVAVVPLAERYAPLRELQEGLASAIVEIDNPGGKLVVGQSVAIELVPWAPVAEVPASTLANQPDGNRRVQVLRDNIVRNISVAVHSRVGTERAFVSGQFRKGDEIITASSKELADGTPVKALLVARATGTGPEQPAAAAPPGAKPAANKPIDGF
jgi:membrane fusion protein, multidrug efflux system